MKKLCVGCGEEIHLKRIELMPNSPFCVKCAEGKVRRKCGIPIQVGVGDHTFNETVIVDEGEFYMFKKYDNKLRKKRK